MKNEKKEVKKFFDEDLLNKGYKKNTSKFKNNLKNYNLPPLDVIEKYEEYYPGFTKQYIANIQKTKEQNQAAKLQMLKSQPYSNKIYQKLEILFISTLVHVVFFLFIKNKIFKSIIISIIAILAFLMYLFLTSWINLRENNKKSQYTNKKISQRKNSVQVR